MHAVSTYRRLLAAPAALAVVAFVPVARAQAQGAPPKATVATVTPYIGYIDFGNFADGPLGTSVTNAPAPLFGVALGIDVAPRVALTGNIGYADTKLRGSLPLLGGYSFGDSKVLLFDAGVHFRLTDPANAPVVATARTQIVPFLEAGLGGIRFDERVGPLNTVATNFAANIGGGVDIPISSNVALRISIKDYIGKFNFSDALGEAIGGRIDAKVSNNFAITGGLRFSF